MNYKTFAAFILIILLAGAATAAYATFKHAAFSIGDGKDINLWGSLIGNGSIKDVTCISNCTGYVSTSSETNASNLTSGTVADARIAATLTGKNTTGKNIGNILYADQYTTIQDAINASNTASNTEIYVPAGIYSLSNYITPKSNLIIRGAGKNATILKASSVLSYLVYLDGIDNFTLADLTLDGNFTTIDVIHSNQSIPYTTMNDITFDSITVKNALNINIDVFGISDRFNIENSNIENAGLDGIHMQYSMKAISIQNNNIINNTRDGIVFGDLEPGGNISLVGIPVTNVTITKNKITGSGIGINIENCDFTRYAPCDQNILISENNLYDNANSGFYTGGGAGTPSINIQHNNSGVVVIGNTVSGGFNGISVGTSGDAPGNIISGNFIHDNNALPGDAQSQSGLFVNGNNTVITSNMIVNQTQYGIYLIGVGRERSQIISNQIRNIQKHGIYIDRQAGKEIISTNQFYNNGLLANNTYSDIYSNDQGVEPGMNYSIISTNLFYAGQGNRTKYGIDIPNTISKNNLIISNIFYQQGTANHSIPAGNNIINNY